MTSGSLPPGSTPIAGNAGVGGIAGIPLVHADASCVVVDKPSGLLSVPGRGPDKADCAASRVQAAFADARVVHRLDMATSGLLLMARGLPAQRALSEAFARGEARKRYVAVVQGHVPPPEAFGPLQALEGEEGWGLIDLPLAADWPRRPLQKVDAQGGRPSRTLWRVLERIQGRIQGREVAATRLALAPLTGRSHQLRVHLQALGHPILGDALYAPPEVVAGFPRLLLHATRLSVPHPEGGVRCEWRSEVPF